jgi:hypothetical protein
MWPDDWTQHLRLGLKILNMAISSHLMIRFLSLCRWEQSKWALCLRVCYLLGK